MRVAAADKSCGKRRRRRRRRVGRATRRNNFAIFIAQLSRWLSCDCCDCQVFGCQVVAPTPSLPPYLPPLLPLPLEARQIKPLSAGDFLLWECATFAAHRLRAAYLSICLPVSLSFRLSFHLPLLLYLSVSVSALTFIKQTARTQTVQLFAQWVTQSTGHPVNKSCTHSLTHTLIESFTQSFASSLTLSFTRPIGKSCRRKLQASKQWKY